MQSHCSGYLIISHSKTNNITIIPNKKKDEKDTIVFNSTLNDDIADMPRRKADTS